MEPGEKKFVRMTLEELDRYGWKPPDQSNLLNRQEGISSEESHINVQNFQDMQNTPHTTENAASSSAVVLWRMVTPLIEALKLTNSQ